jgi:hypothetical protein
MKLQYIIEIETNDNEENINVWVDILKKIFRENAILCCVCGDYLSIDLTDENQFIIRCPTCSQIAEPILEREYDFCDFGYFNIGSYIRNRFIDFKKKEKIK